MFKNKSAIEHIRSIFHIISMYFKRRRIFSSEVERIFKIKFTKIISPFTVHVVRFLPALDATWHVSHPISELAGAATRRSNLIIGRTSPLDSVRLLARLWVGRARDSSLSVLRQHPTINRFDV